jgi:hypothetical protein
MLGVYVGQEYGDSIPSVKVKTYEMIDKFRTTDLYKKICEDIKSK